VAFHTHAHKHRRHSQHARQQNWPDPTHHASIIIPVPPKSSSKTQFATRRAHESPSLRPSISTTWQRRETDPGCPSRRSYPSLSPLMPLGTHFLPKTGIPQFPSRNAGGHHISRPCDGWFGGSKKIVLSYKIAPE
jgi:hypothetical protein